MSKFFKAIHKESKEEIEFGLEDIKVATGYRDKLQIETSLIFLGLFEARSIELINDWKDYEVFYQHQGEWFKYE